MRGKCEHCDVEYPVEDLAGYNVRYGRITSSLCNSCVSMLGGAKGERWYEGLIGRAAYLRRNSERVGVRTWVQGRIEEA